MMPFKKCPVCGGELESKKVQKLLQGGGNTVMLEVDAEVCMSCGERLYAETVIKSFEDIRLKLQKNEFTHFRALGKSFTIDDDEWPNKTIRPSA